MTHHPTDDANNDWYNDVLRRLEAAGDNVEEALNTLADRDNYDRRSELFYALGVIRGVTEYYIKQAVSS